MREGRRKGGRDVKINEAHCFVIYLFRDSKKSKP